MDSLTQSLREKPRLHGLGRSLLLLLPRIINLLHIVSFLRIFSLICLRTVLPKLVCSFGCLHFGPGSLPLHSNRAALAASSLPGMLFIFLCLLKIICRIRIASCGFHWRS